MIGFLGLVCILPTLCHAPSLLRLALAESIQARHTCTWHHILKPCSMLRQPFHTPDRNRKIKAVSKPKNPSRQCFSICCILAAAGVTAHQHRPECSTALPPYSCFDNQSDSDASPPVPCCLLYYSYADHTQAHSKGLYTHHRHRVESHLSHSIEINDQPELSHCVVAADSLGRLQGPPPCA